MLTLILTALGAAIHRYIVWLEMAASTKPQGLRAFGLTPEFAEPTRVLAANQGLHNSFLAAGLLWALLAGVQDAGRPPAMFFLSCVLVAGVYGAATASRRILSVQALPAALTVAALAPGL